MIVKHPPATPGLLNILKCFIYCTKQILNIFGEKKALSDSMSVLQELLVDRTRTRTKNKPEKVDHQDQDKSQVQDLDQDKD